MLACHIQRMGSLGELDSSTYPRHLPPATSVLHHFPRLARKHSLREVHDRSIKKMGNRKRVPPGSSFHQGSRLKIQRRISGNQQRVASVFRSCRWRYLGQRVTITVGTTKPAYGCGLGFETPSLLVWIKSAVFHGNSSARARILRRASRKIDISWAMLPRCPQRPVTTQSRFSIKVYAPSPLKRGAYETPQQATDSTLSFDAKAKVLDAAVDLSEKACSFERVTESAGRVAVLPSEVIKSHGRSQQQEPRRLQTVPERMDVVRHRDPGLLSFASGHDQKNVDAVYQRQCVHCPRASTSGLDGASRVSIAAVVRLTSHFQWQCPHLSPFPALKSTGSNHVVLRCCSECIVPSQPLSVQEGVTPETTLDAAGLGLLAGCCCYWQLLPEKWSVGSHTSDQVRPAERRATRDASPSCHARQTRPPTAGLWTKQASAKQPLNSTRFNSKPQHAWVLVLGGLVAGTDRGSRAPRG